MTIRTLPVALLSWLLISAQAAQAEGELMVMPASLKVYNNHEHSVKVKNVGDAPLYLSISLQKVMNPGVEPEIKVPLSQLDHPAMLASPDKLTLGPGQSRAISLKSLTEPAVEALYRLYIVPVRQMQVVEAPESKITAPMSVAIGYGVLIRHMPPPAKQKADWSYRCEAGGVTLENKGNIRLILSEIGLASGMQRQKMALFPGVPQYITGRVSNIMVNGASQTLSCN